MAAGDFLDRLYRKARRRLGIAKEYRIGRFTITLTSDHDLDLYQALDPLTETALGEIVRIAARKYPDLTVVDIGANVGDTAALICRYQDVPILCIEGHPDFANQLRANLKRLPPGIEIAECLVGSKANEVPVEALRRHRGTATLKPNPALRADKRSIRVRTLPDILGDHPKFMQPRLIKIDTDGWDFEILLSSADVIGKLHPILFFEYALHFRTSTPRQSMDAIRVLQDLGYNRFLVFDNLGNFVGPIDDHAIERFRAMNRYLLSQRLFGRPAIDHYDIGAFTSADGDLAIEIEECWHAMVDRRIRDAGFEGVRSGDDVPRPTS